MRYESPELTVQASTQTSVQTIQGSKPGGNCFDGGNQATSGGAYEVDE